MKRMVYFCLCLAFAFGGCKSQKTFVPFSDLNGEWDIIELNGARLPAGETKQRLTFDMNAHHLSGHAGCNQISGNITYDAQKSDIKFQKVVSTRKACLDMRLEDEFLKALGYVVRFEAETSGQRPETIIFYGADNQKLFVASRRIARE
jgi:heat shock protein HslJ